MSADAILPRLAGLRQTGGAAWSAKCPAHADRTASLRVTQGADGKTLVHCFAGCETSDVLAAIGLDFTALFPDIAPGGKRPWRERYSALEILDILDGEVTIASIILDDIVARKKVSKGQAQVLRLCAGRIGRARDAARRMTA